MTTVEEDLRYLKIALDSFEAYLLSPTLQWPLEKPTRANQPATLTIENFLLARQRLSKREMTAEQAFAFEGLMSRFHDLSQHWRANFGKKASRGFRHRLNLWTQYVSELHNDPQAHADRYPHEVRLRAMLTLLSPYADEVSPGEVSQLDTCDQKLRAIFVAGAFIWPAALQASFPAAPFWYLYGSPQ
ncbi:MAG: hypothetical protein ACOYYS_08020 [Chloroflexota bacterium]